MGRAVGGVVEDLPGVNSEQQTVSRGAAQSKKLCVLLAGNPPRRVLLIKPSLEGGIFDYQEYSVSPTL